MGKETSTSGRKPFVKKHLRDEYDSYDVILRAQDIKNISTALFAKAWRCDSDSITRLVHKFISTNKQGFDFLEIKPVLSSDQKYIIISTGNKVGCIPLYSPSSGKAYATLRIDGRLREDVGELLPLTPEGVQVEFEESLVLPFKSTVRPPIYFECAKFIDKYIEAEKLNWKKFIAEKVVQSYPTGTTDWGRYAVTSIDPYKKLQYLNRKNSLTLEHDEWKMINFVMTLCIKEINRPETPRQTARIYREKVSRLLPSITSSSVKACTSLTIHMSDPVLIKRLKEIGNYILSSVTSEYRAWSMDISKLYEGYVQYVFAKAASFMGARSFNNIHYSVSGNRASWDLSYLEPDLILKKGNKLLSVDAKYKMHMLNRGNALELHDTFRHDLHQVMAYSAFSSDVNKAVVLVYPSNRFHILQQKFRSSQSAAMISAYLVGIPYENTTDVQPLSVRSQETVQELITFLKKEFLKE